jgi:hypothetical protein
MVEHIRPNESEYQQMSEEVTCDLVRSSSDTSVVTVSSEEQKMEITQGETLKLAAAVSPPPELQITIVSDDDIINIPGTKTPYVMGMRLGMHKYPIDDHHREMTADSEAFKQLQQKAINKEIATKEVLMLGTRNYEIHDSRRDGDYSKECGARNSYLNMLNHTAMNLNEEYHDYRTPEQKRNYIAEGYTTVFPDEMIL